MAENATEMSNFVYKTIKFASTANSEHVLNALMLGEKLGMGGEMEYARVSLEEMANGTDKHGYTTAGFISDSSYSIQKLYEADTAWDSSTIINLLNENDVGLINHLGHGNTDKVMKVTNGQFIQLTNTNLFFLYSQACYPGAFDMDSAAERLTTSSRKGAVAVMLNSRYGWGNQFTTDSPSSHFAREFWDAYFGEGKYLLGEINEDSHEDNIWRVSDPHDRWVFFETNLHGDPHLSIRHKEAELIIQVKQ